MSPTARRFYLRYYMFTRLLPVYLTALVSYGLAFAAVESLAQAWRGTGFLGGGLLLCLGLCRWIGGYAAAGILTPLLCPGPGRELQERVARLWPAEVELPQLNLVELGAVVFIAVSPAPAGKLWLSTHAARTLPDSVLRAVLLHEAAHGPGLRWDGAWPDLLWLLAWPAAWLLSPLPLLVFAAVLVHAQAYLHLQQWLREREEARADRWAMARMGRMEYAGALAAYLALFEQGRGDGLRRGRLSRMGLGTAEIDSLV